MNAVFASQIPEEVIRAVFELDGGISGGRLKSHAGHHDLPSAGNGLPSPGSDGQPLLSGDQRQAALAWLRRILLDFEALDQHIALLQELYGAPFQYSRPRRELRHSEQPTEPAAASNFVYIDRWNETSETSETNVISLLDEGFEVLQRGSDAEIGRLLLNPYALYDLFDVLDEVQPEAWMNDLQELASMVLGTNTQVAGDELTDPAKASTQPSGIATSPAPGQEFWDRLTAVLADAVKEARRGSTATVSVATNGGLPTTNGLPASWASRYALPAACALACAACLAFIWVAMQANSIQTQVATLADSAMHRREIDGQVSIEPQATSGTARTLKDFAKSRALDLTPEYTAHDCVQRLERASVELKELIRLLREDKHMDDGKIVDYLRRVVATDHTEDKTP